jgi:hypothetical protein
MSSLLSAQLTAKAFWLKVSDPTLSMAEAKRRVAKELGEEHRKAGIDRRLAAASVQPSLHRAGPDHVRTLIARVCAMVERMAAVPPKRVRLNAAPPAPAPPPPPRKPLRDRIADLVTEPEPQPEPTPTPPMVRSQNSSTGVQVIPEEEFPQRFRDPVLAAWKASIQNNVVNFDSRRGSKPKPLDVYIG